MEVPGRSAELWFAASLPDIISQGKWRNEPLPLRCPKYTLTSDVRLSMADLLRCASLHGFSCYCKTNPPFILTSRGLWLEQDVRRPSHSTVKVTNLWGRRRGVGCQEEGGERERGGGGGLIRPDLHRTSVPHTIPSVPIHLMFCEIILRPLEKREESEQ